MNLYQQKQFGKIKIPYFGIYDVSVMLMVFVIVALYNITPIVIAFQLFALLCTIITWKRTISRIECKYIVWWTLFTTYCGITLIWDVNKATNLSMMISIFQVIVVGFVIIRYIDTMDKLVRILKVVVYGNVLLAARMIIQVPFSALGSGRIGVYLGAEYGNDGAAMVLCYGCLFAYVLSEIVHNNKHKQWIIPLIALALLSGTRLSLVTLLVGILCMIIMYKEKLSKKVYYIMTILLAVSIAFYLMMTNEILYSAVGYRFEALLTTLINGADTNATYHNSSDVRLLLIKYGIDLFKNRPIFGYGLDGYRIVTPLAGYYAHNNYIEIMVDLGLIGLVLYYWFPIELLINSIKQIKVDRKQALSFGMLVSVFVSDIATVSFNQEKMQLFLAISICLFRIIEHKYILGDNSND